MIPMDFGVFDLSVYPFITVVRKREEKSGYDKKNFFMPVPSPCHCALQASPLLLSYVLYLDLQWL